MAHTPLLLTCTTEKVWCRGCSRVDAHCIRACPSQRMGMAKFGRHSTARTVLSRDGK